MKKILSAAAILLFSLLQGAEAVSKNGIYILSNSLLTAEIAPAQGGKVIRLYDKKNKAELAKAYSALEAPAGSGLFAERLWPTRGRQYRHYETTPYKVVSVKSDKNSAELKLLCESKPLDIEKTYILNDKEAVLRVRYALSNPGNEAFTGRFWSSSVIAPPGKKWTITLPRGHYSDKGHKGPEKKVILTHAPANPQPGNHWLVEPKQEWGSVTDDKTGALLAAPFEFLGTFYCHIAQSKGADAPTMEWMTFPLHIKPLSVGKADAVNHPELEDPLQDYIVRFETSIALTTPKDAGKNRPLPTAKKNTRFLPVLTAGKAHMEFATLPAVPWFANQKESPGMIFFAGHNISAEAFDFLRRFKSNSEIIEGWRMGGSGDTVYAGYAIPSPIAMTEKMLKGKVDVIFIPGFTNTTMPKTLKKQLIDKVKKGAVVIYVSDRNRFTDLFPAKGGTSVPADIFKGIPFKADIREFKVGKGKVFFVPFRLHLNNRMWSQHNLLLPAPEKNAVSHEYIYAAYCRLLRYALDFKAPASLNAVKIKGNKAELTIVSTVAAPAAVNGRKYTLVKGANKIIFPFKAETLNGKYDLPLILDVNGHTADIFIAQYEIKNLPALRSFTTAKYAHETNEAVKGSLELEGKGDVILSLLDAEKRIIGQEIKKSVSGKVTFSIKPAFAGVNSFCRLEAQLFQNGKCTEVRSLTLSRRTPDDSKIQFVLWHNSRISPTAMIRHQGAREMGFTHLMGSQGHAMAHLESRLGAEAIQQTGARYMVNTLYRFFQNQINKEKRFRNPCLRDPKGLQTIRQQTALRAGKHVQNFPVRYYSSDENSLGWHDVQHDYCRTPHCLAGFRKAMEKHYGTLAKLNQSWNTKFKTWQEVIPPTLSEARKTGHFAAWMAHRIYMLEALNDGMTALLDELHKIDPQAKLAHSGQGLTRINDCWDWRKMLDHYSLSNLYARMGGLPDYIRTTRPGYAAGNWNGYGMPLPQIRFTTWNDIADGMFAPAYWYDCYFFRRGDNALNEAGLHMKHVISEIKQSGADPLMTTGKRVLSPFTLVYSPESLVAAAVTGNFSAINSGTYNGNLTGWVRLLRSAGFPAPQIIGDNLISQVTPENTKVLVLPLLQLMSNAQVEHIKKYVLAGGILVVDAQAAVFDEFYTLRKTNPLLELAGVKAPFAKGTSGGTLHFGNLPVRLIPAGSAVEAAGAKALGTVSVNTPGARFNSIELGPVKRTLGGAFFCRNAGKGKVIYINALFHGVPSILNDPAQARPLLSAFRTLFEKAGVRALHTGGSDVSIAEYTKGRYRMFVGTRRQGTGCEKSVYPLTKSYYLYDTLLHKSLSRSSSVEFSFNSHDVKTLIATEKPLQTPRFTVNRRNGVVEILSGSDSGIWFVQMFRDGVELKSLSRTVVLDKNDKAEFNFGLNCKGKCEIRLLNIMDGKKLNY